MANHNAFDHRYHVPSVLRAPRPVGSSAVRFTPPLSASPLSQLDTARARWILWTMEEGCKAPTRTNMIISAMNWVPVAKVLVAKVPEALQVETP